MPPFTPSSEELRSYLYFSTPDRLCHWVELVPADLRFLAYLYIVFTGAQAIQLTQMQGGPRRSI